MARQRDPTLVEQHAAELERRAREMRQEAARLRREQTARQDRRAGRVLRRYWRQGWEGFGAAAIRDELEAIFGAPPGSECRATTGADEGPRKSPDTHAFLNERAVATGGG